MSQESRATGSGSFKTSVQLTVREDRSKEPKWIREGKRGPFGAHWSFTAGLVVILFLAVLIASYDAWLVHAKGLELFDATLLAQAEAVLAIVAVIGGSFAAWRFLTPGAREP